MTKKYDGGPAFPSENEDYGVSAAGMSLRDYFAGQAIAGSAVDTSPQSRYSKKYISNFAYEIADQMLAQRDFVAPIAKEGDDE